MEGKWRTGGGNCTCFRPNNQMKMRVYKKKLDQMRILSLYLLSLVWSAVCAQGPAPPVRASTLHWSVTSPAPLVAGQRMTSISIGMTNVGTKAVFVKRVAISFASEDSFDSGYSAALVSRCDSVNAPGVYYDWTASGGKCSWGLTPTKPAASNVTTSPVMAQFLVDMAATPGTAPINVAWWDKSGTEHAVVLFATKAPRTPFRVRSFDCAQPVVACGATASLQWTATGGGAICTLFANGKTAVPAGKVTLPFGSFTSGPLRADTTFTLQTISQGRPGTTQLTVFVGPCGEL